MGDEGVDALPGGSGNDALDGGAGDDVVYGADGNDTLAGDGDEDSLHGGRGRDSLDGGSGDDRRWGGHGDDWLFGADSHDILEGGMGDDEYVADMVHMVVELADDGRDRGSAGISYVLGANVETLVLTGTGATNGMGNTGANRITGNGANNVPSGLDGTDTLVGGTGNNTLDGGLRTDVLTGETGTDNFAFSATHESGLGTQRDTITDFAKAQDDIVLSRIDANTAMSGNQAFKLDAGGAFRAGEIHQTRSGSNLLITLNTDDDTTAELSILLGTVTGPLAADDFLF